MPQVSENHHGKVYLVGAGPGDPRLDHRSRHGMSCGSEPGIVRLSGESPTAAIRSGVYGMRLPWTSARRPGNAPARDQSPHGGGSPERQDCGSPQERRSFSFRRGAEEVEALTAAGVPFEVVPGVTAAFAVASHAGIPLTHRDLASAVALVTGHRRSDGAGPELEYGTLAQFPGTLVFYMGMTNSRRWSEALLRGGRSPDTPVAIVRRATWPDQETVRCTLGTVADVIEQRKLFPPAVIVVGEVAGLT